MGAGETVALDRLKVPEQQPPDPLLPRRGDNLQVRAQRNGSLNLHGHASPPWTAYLFVCTSHLDSRVNSRRLPLGRDPCTGLGPCILRKPRLTRDIRQITRYMTSCFFGRFAGTLSGPSYHPHHPWAVLAASASTSKTHHYHRDDIYQSALQRPIATPSLLPRKGKVSISPLPTGHLITRQYSSANYRAESAAEGVGSPQVSSLVANAVGAISQAPPRRLGSTRAPGPGPRSSPGEGA